MSLESIIEHIINEANSQKEIILQDARLQAKEIIKNSNKDAEKFYQEILDKEKARYESQKQKLIVNARLQTKKDLLFAQQEAIDAVFNRLKSEIKKDTFKKQQISQDRVQEVPENIDFYFQKIRSDFETEIAKVLFG